MPVHRLGRERKRSEPTLAHFSSKTQSMVEHSPQNLRVDSHSPESLPPSYLSALYVLEAYLSILLLASTTTAPHFILSSPFKILSVSVLPTV